MDSEVLNAQDCGVTPGYGYGESNRIALQRAVDEVLGVGGGTIYIPAGVYEFAGAINVQISTAASVTGALSIRGEESATLVQSVGTDLFVVTDARNNAFVGHALFEGLSFQPATA